MEFTSGWDSQVAIGHYIYNKQYKATIDSGTVLSRQRKEGGKKTV